MIYMLENEPFEDKKIIFKSSREAKIYFIIKNEIDEYWLSNYDDMKDTWDYKQGEECSDCEYGKGYPFPYSRREYNEIIKEIASNLYKELINKQVALYCELEEYVGNEICSKYWEKTKEKRML